MLTRNCGYNIDPITCCYNFYQLKFRDRPHAEFSGSFSVTLFTVELLDSSMLWQLVSRIAIFCLIMVGSTVLFN